MPSVSGCEPSCARPNAPHSSLTWERLRLTEALPFVCRQELGRRPWLAFLFLRAFFLRAFLAMTTSLD